MSPRVGFFVDGFNLYHSVAAFAEEASDESVKWLDRAEQGVRPLLARC
jgi:hypothetical protein